LREKVDHLSETRRGRGTTKRRAAYSGEQTEYSDSQGGEEPLQGLGGRETNHFYWPIKPDTRENGKMAVGGKLRSTSGITTTRINGVHSTASYGGEGAAVGSTRGTPLGRRTNMRVLGRKTRAQHSTSQTDKKGPTAKIMALEVKK